MATDHQSDPGKQGSLTGFLGTIERVGNAVPHPAIIFFILIGIIIALSAIFGLMGTSVTYEGYNYELGEITEQTTAVRSLLSADGIRFMVTSPVANFLAFTGVGVILVAMIGVGLAEESGLIATLVRKLVMIAPASCRLSPPRPGTWCWCRWPLPPSTASGGIRWPVSPPVSAASRRCSW